MVNVLDDQTAHIMGGLELQGEYASRGKDAKERLNALVGLLDPAGPLIHPALNPGWGDTDFAWAIGIWVRRTLN